LSSSVFWLALWCK